MNNALIEKYFRGLCTEEEAITVSLFLKNHPDHPYLLEAWEAADSTTPLPDQYSHQMLEVVNAAILPVPVNNKKQTAWMLAAAAILVGILLIVFLLNSTKEIPSTVAKNNVVPVSRWSILRNRSEKDSVLVLADGSRVTLSPQATVRYRTDFNDPDKREIFMTGRVLYQVAKNKKKPFIVYSKSISTTALGTAFCVIAPDTAAKMNVKLFEGKVVVILKGSNGRVIGKKYLLPGQELDIDPQTKTFALHLFKAIKNKVAAPAQVQDTLTGGGTSYMFNNQTLADVLDQLAAMYSVRIEYPKATIGNMYFIGKIDREDSLDKIIHDIGSLNMLSVKKQHDGYVLRKK